MTNPWLRIPPAAALAVAIILTAGGASAFHPGETHTGEVPQGPDQVACDNEGRQGIDQAISVGGQVHCDDCDDDDNGDDGDGDVG